MQSIICRQRYQRKEQKNLYYEDPQGDRKKGRFPCGCFFVVFFNEGNVAFSSRDREGLSPNKDIGKKRGSDDGHGADEGESWPAQK